MRTTNEIICAVKDNEPVTHEELRLALLALSGIEHFIRHDLHDLVQCIKEDKPMSYLELKANFSEGTLERMFTAIKTDPEKWLGPANIPGNPEHDERLKWAKKLFEKATGEKL